jgi:hypothetical protein
MIMSNKLDIAKKIIKENFKSADCGIFNCRNWAGDPMTNIYSSDGLRIDICYYYAYFEVFGLSEEEFDELKEYYKGINRR